jgi:hypothetical protein
MLRNLNNVWIDQTLMSKCNRLEAASMCDMELDWLVLSCQHFASCHEKTPAKHCFYYIKYAYVLAQLSPL